MKKTPKKKRGDHLQLYFIVCLSLILGVSLGVSALLTLLIEFLTKSDFTLPATVWMLLISVAIGGVMTVLLSRVFLAPITRLSRAMRKVAEGDFSVRLDHAGRVGEMRESYENFNTMARALQSTEMLQSDFVANVSHEIKTPVNAIEGYAMLMQDAGEQPERQREYAERILLNTRRLSELVNNVLLLSKVENQTIPAERRVYRLDEQLRRALLALERKWTEKKLELDVELESVAYTGNEGLMQHVWLNLIDNAIKFDREGGLLQLRLFRQGDRLVVTVTDNGVGMTQEEMGKIFDRFYQADNSHRGEGNGLGLALVQRILHVCGGEIKVESAPGRGSRFTVTLSAE